MRTLTFTLPLLLAATPLAAQGDPRLARLDPETRPQMVRLIDSLARTGLPREPLIDKALEGQAKAAPGPRILAAVRAWGADLARVRDTLGRGSSEPVLVAGASMVRAGVPLSTLGDLARARQGADLLLPLTVITDLTAAGTPPEAAADAVVALAVQGAPDAEFRALQRSAGRGQGRPPQAGPGRGQGRGQGRPPRTVPGNKGNGKGKGPGNGNGNGGGPAAKP
jgi:hypothetical protein